MSSIPSTSLSTGLHTDTHLLGSTTPVQTYLQIFQASLLFILAAPMLLGIYESWRKKQVTSPHVQNSSHSFNPVTLYFLGFQELRSPRWSASLETLPVAEAHKISLTQLSEYQFSLLMSRAEFVNAIDDDSLLQLYNSKKYATDLKEFFTYLSNHQLLILLDRANFSPWDQFIFFEVLISRPDIVNNLSGNRLLTVYKKCKDKQKAFVTSLNSRQLLALLTNESFNLDDAIAIFELTLDSQIDHVNILARLCTAYSMHLATLPQVIKSNQDNFFANKAKLKALIPDFLDKAKRKFASIPIPLTSDYLSQSCLNQFSFLFFSPEQLHKINFKNQRFSTVECMESGDSYQLSEKETTPQKWLESLCVLFDESLLKEREETPLKEEIPNYDNLSPDERTALLFEQSRKLFYRIPLPTLPSFSSIDTGIRDAKAQLQKLSVRQVAFLLRRTYGMKCWQQIREAVFQSHVVGSGFLTCYRDDFDAPDVEHEPLPDLSISEAYQILELKPESSWDEIRAQYKKKSLLYHPDRCDDKDKAAKAFKKLNEAYHFLERITDN